MVKDEIYGISGPPMTGVIHYPYSASQRLYRDDFEMSVMSTVTHPFCLTTKAGASSLPHNILSGSNFDDGKLGGLQKSWHSEHDRSFMYKNPNAAKHYPGSGVRSECLRFLS